MESLLDGLKRRIVRDVLEVLYEGGDLESWARSYRANEEIIVPGELEFVGRLSDYVRSKRAFRAICSPRYYSEMIDKSV